MKNTITLELTLPDPYFAMWQGLKAMHGLDEDFLNFMATKVIKKTLITFMTESKFAE